MLLVKFSNLPDLSEYTKLSYSLCKKDKKKQLVIMDLIKLIYEERITWALEEAIQISH